MHRKQTKTKTAEKKTTKRRSRRKPADATKVRAQIAGLVKSEAKEITEAVLNQAMHGEVAPAKFLFEMAGVYPASTDESKATKEEDSLARTLLDRLNIPDSPVVAELDNQDAEIPKQAGKSTEPGQEKSVKADEGSEPAGE